MSIILNFFVNFIRLMPHGLALAFGRFVGRLLRLILWKKVDRCEVRCVASLGVGITIAREIIKQSFMNIGMSVVEFIRLPKMKPELEKYIDFPEDSVKLLNEALSRGHGAILMTTHMANWELAAARVIREGFPLFAVYTAQRDNAVNNIIMDIRTKASEMTMIDSDTGLRTIFKTLKAGGIVVIMQDLDARKDGVIADFLGLPASTHTGIVHLFRKFHVPVVAAHYVRDMDNPAHHVVMMQEILSDREGFGEDLRESLEMCNSVIGEWIRERPGLWLWLLDRWEYTLGKKV